MLEFPVKFADFLDVKTLRSRIRSTNCIRSRWYRPYSVNSSMRGEKGENIHTSDICYLWSSDFVTFKRCFNNKLLDINGVIKRMSVNELWKCNERENGFVFCTERVWTLVHHCISRRPIGLRNCDTARVSVSQKS